MVGAEFALTLYKRAFCASSLGASAWANAMNAQATWPGLADDVNPYLSLGEHRAGMPSEERTAAWIRQRLDKLGCQTEFQKFPIRTLLQPGGQITAGNLKSELFPQW